MNVLTILRQPTCSLIQCFKNGYEIGADLQTPVYWIFGGGSKKNIRGDAFKMIVDARIELIKPIWVMIPYNLVKIFFIVAHTYFLITGLSLPANRALPNKNWMASMVLRSTEVSVLR